MAKHGSNPFGEGARCYPPYDATPGEGQEDDAQGSHEEGHHGDQASEASAEDHDDMAPPNFGRLEAPFRI